MNSLKLSLFLTFLILISSRNNLRFVFMVHRHGARAPYTDSNNVDMLGEIWPEGSHKITNLSQNNKFRHSSTISFRHSRSRKIQRFSIRNIFNKRSFRNFKQFKSRNSKCKCTFNGVI